MYRRRILKQMFDVRPVDESGELDWEKIERVGEITDIKMSPKTAEYLSIRKLSDPEKDEAVSVRKPVKKEVSVYQLGQAFRSHEVPMFHEFSEEPWKSSQPRRDWKINYKEIEKNDPIDYVYDDLVEETYEEVPGEGEVDFEPDEDKISFPKLAPWNFNIGKTAVSFAGAMLVVAVVISGFNFLGKGLDVKSRVLGVSNDGFDNLTSAVENVKNQDFENSSLDFNKAYDNFSQASENMDTMGTFLINLTKFFPGISQLASGKSAVEAGKNLSLAGESMSEAIKIIYALENPLEKETDNAVSLVDIFKSTEEKLKDVRQALGDAWNNIEDIKVDDLPDDKKDEFIVLKNKLPTAIEAIDTFLNNSHILMDLLGGNGPRKYLFLFQNNQEMRATGGFIGSYGLLDISNGEIRKFFIDGIFNPDGQFRDKIVPPKPIQKISAAWSLHDSNWFPNFPTSAEKAIVFYEKTGGPTADGVITLTPTMLGKMLEITGPVEMKEYNVILSADNFIEEIQEEVEVNYNKEDNRPKQILADLAPIVLDKIFNSKDLATISKTLKVFSEGLNQKQILLYSQNEELQKIISDQGWSGEILDTAKDYVSIINSNINGYKTDGVIEESINHRAEIQEDGSIIDTVEIARKHNGGNEQYEWWNKVNANYMRVYVPKGSTLLSVDGQTIEFNDSPLDYDKLGFKRDKDVQKEEEGMSINVASGVRTYEDAGKTVFASWTYVSPQETTVIKYKYLLPFKINFDKENPSSSYSLLAQKQSGSIGSEFVSEIKYPAEYNVTWKYPNEIKQESAEIKFNADLKTDKFIGVVFLKK